MHCKVCGTSMRRVARDGFVQQHILPLFGFYPWQCPMCRSVSMYRKKNKRKRRSEFRNSGS